MPCLFSRDVGPSKLTLLNSRTPSLIHIPLVTLCFLHRFDVFGSCFPGFGAFFLDDLMERYVNILGHSGGVTANVEMSSFLQPGIDFPRFLEHPILYIHLLSLISRECQVEPVENPLSLHCLEL